MIPGASDGTSLAIERDERMRKVNSQTPAEPEKEADVSGSFRDAVGWASVSSVWVGSFEPFSLKAWRKTWNDLVQNRSSGR
jgi:hypothetical protein